MLQMIGCGPLEGNNFKPFPFYLLISPLSILSKVQMLPLYTNGFIICKQMIIMNMHEILLNQSIKQIELALNR